MHDLTDILLAPSRKGAVAADLLQLIDRHVALRRGLRGLSLKAGLATLKSTRPDALPRAVDRFLPEFVEALEPLFRRFLDSDSADFGAFLDVDAHAREAANALIARADRRIAAAANPKVKSGYQRFRGVAQDEAAAAMPEIGRLIGRHVRVAGTALAAHRA